MSKFRKIFLVIFVLSTFLLSGCAGDNANKVAADDSILTASNEESTTEPSAMQIDFTGTDMKGNTVSSDILAQSRITMINVWATYCGPCLSEMPELGELAAEYDAEEFQLIGIVSDVLEGEDQALAESLIQQTGANYTHLLLNESIYYALLTDVTAVPTTFFLDSDGAILDRVLGAKEKSVWEEKIDALLEEQ